MGDQIKAYLRKKDFPEVVPEALTQMQKLWLPDCTSQQLRLMKELSQEFVFFEVDQWCRVREQRISPIKELHIIEEICSYFRHPGPLQKFTTFMFLFPFGSSMMEPRLPLLNKLVSFALAFGNTNVLTYVGTWMQLAGCSSDYCIFLAKNVHQERFRESAINNVMKNLPVNCQLFCASLLTSMATIYQTDSPPDHVIELILFWLKIKPSFCFAPLNLEIPKTFNFSGPQCPLSELIRWTVLSPLDNSNSHNEVYKTLFLKLHLAILQCFENARQYGDTSRWEALPADKIQPVVTILKESSNASPDNISLSLERLAQSLDLGLGNQCVHPKSGKLKDLFVCCVDLPYHQLLKIVLQKWSYEVDAVKMSSQSTKT